MSKFKIHHRGSGLNFTAEYRDTVAGAVKFARSKGWYASGATDMLQRSLQMKPTSADIYARVAGDGWELIATVSEAGVKPVHSRDRRSVTQACERIKQLEAAIDAADELEVTLGDA